MNDINTVVSYTSIFNNLSIFNDLFIRYISFIFIFLFLFILFTIIYFNLQIIADIINTIFSYLGCNLIYNEIEYFIYVNL